MIIKSVNRCGSVRSTSSSGAAAIAMGWFGAVAVAAHAVALQTAGMTFMVPLGIGQAATARVGLFAGAREWRAVARAGCW